MTETLVITLPPDLAEQLGAGKLLVEAVPLTGDAIFRGAWRQWSDENGVRVGHDEIFPDADTQRALEALFTKAMRSKATDDAATIREADYQHSRTREASRGIRYSQHVARNSYRKSKGL